MRKIILWCLLFSLDGKVVYSQQKIFLDDMKMIQGNIDSVSLNSFYIHTKGMAREIPISKILVVADESKSINFYNREKGLYALGKSDAKAHHRSYIFLALPLALEAAGYYVFSEVNSSIGLTIMPLVFINSWILASYINIAPKQKKIGKLDYRQFTLEEFYIAGYQQHAKKKNKKNVLFAMGLFILPIGILLSTK